MMIRVSVHSIQVSLLTQQRIVVLREQDSRRYLPIWIGPFEADAIALALQGHLPPRPLTHDLLRTSITDLGGTIEQIQVTDLQDGTFYARILVRQNGGQLEIDARPSDAIALAVRADVPIFVAEQVMERGGQFFEEEEEQPASASAPAQQSTPEAAPTGEEDDNLTLFRDFINTLDIKGRKDPDKE